jgi:hypothetical protein
MRCQLGMRRWQMEHGVALARAKTDIATRIRKVCETFNEAEFVELVNRMAEIDVRYRLRDDWSVSTDSTLTYSPH